MGKEGLFPEIQRSPEAADTLISPFWPIEL